MLRLVIHVDQTEPRTKTLIPLEIVQKRPIKITRHRNALLHGFMDITQMTFNILPPQGILRGANPVLGDHDRQAVFLEFNEQVVQSFRINIPPERIFFHRVMIALTNIFRKIAETPLLEFHQLPRIIIEPDEIEAATAKIARLPVLERNVMEGLMAGLPVRKIAKMLHRQTNTISDARDRAREMIR